VIYIVRHGQTAWNLQKRKQGRMDSPLTLKGIRQAHNVAEILKREVRNLDQFRIVISPQWRCQQFSSIICELLEISYSDCILEEGIREHSFGLWEGKTEEEIEVLYPGFLSRRYQVENQWSYIVPMGESYEILSNRIGKILNKYQGQDVIFICHEMVSKTMRGNLLQLENQETTSLHHNQDEIYRIKEGCLEVLRNSKD
jgi:broad specificity phosphatase PhoE